MKQLKKTLSLLLAFCLLLSFSATAFAAYDDVALPTVEGKQNEIDVKKHTFEAYQIFEAKYAEKADGTTDTTQLVSIKWGDGVNPNALFDELKDGIMKDALEGVDYTANDSALETNPSALAVAKVVAGYPLDDETQARNFALVVEKHLTTTFHKYEENVDAGYYLVVDKATNGDGVDEVFNLSVLMMSSAAAFKPTAKADIPEVDKMVLEVNDSEDMNPTWAKEADYDINDEVEFVLSGTLPTNYADYEKYAYTFTDTLDNGFTLDRESIRVYINGSTDAITSGYSVGGEGQTFTVAFDDLKTAFPDLTASSYIQVRYTATLNSSAVVGSAGNTNTVTLTYSNNPNAGGEADTSTTTPITVTVYTYRLTVNKTKENGDALAGAEFELYKKMKKDGATEYTYELVSKPTATTGAESDVANVFTFSGLDAGDYKLVESEVPAGFNKAEDMYFTISSTVEGAAKGKPIVAKITADEEGQKEILDAKGQPAFKILTNETGMLTTSIVNMSGLVLPSTGGIGTTIFYIAGGLLLVGAGVLLIAKKRMGNNK